MNPPRLALLALALVPPSLLAADWTRFRGPDGLGTAPDKDIPVAIGSSNILWKTPIPGRGNSSPIVSKGKIFVQTASTDASRRSLVCVDAKSGKVEWSKDVKGTLAKTHPKNTMASSTPAADGERVYAVFWDGKHISLTAWDYSGKELWAKDLGPFVSQHGPGLSPMVVGDRVILNIDQDDLAEVAAFDVKTGEQIWKKSRTAYRACYTTPFVLEQNGRPEVIVSSTAGVTAYDPKDGAAIWNWTWVWKSTKSGQGGALRQVGGPIYHDGLLFIISGDGGGDRHMVALKPGTSGEVPDSAVVWRKTKETAYVPMVVASGPYLFWIADKENKALCVEAKTGKVIWDERLPGSKPVSASPVLVDGKVYSISEDGRVYVFEAGPKFNLLAESNLKEDVFATPAVADGRMYVRGANHLFCIGNK
ncbi:MAG: PQQ-binding-like beta-propeller repeat protein [Zavarzinella sp.]|nr:PQQ-binding-like beta-propeller repeat protein [Zavarzinella sp.]